MCVCVCVRACVYMYYNLYYVAFLCIVLSQYYNDG